MTLAIEAVEIGGRLSGLSRLRGQNRALAHGLVEAASFAPNNRRGGATTPARPGFYRRDHLHQSDTCEGDYSCSLCAPTGRGHERPAP